MQSSFHRVSNGRVEIGPPSDEDLEWIMARLAEPAIYRALGWSESVGSEIYAGYVEGTALLLPLRNRVGLRIGFFLLMRPTLAHRSWTVNVAIPEPGHRNAFTAIAGCDALCELIFGAQKDDGLEWLIEPENGASRALPKRLGYTKTADVERDGVRYERYVIGPDAWTRRKRAKDIDFFVENVPFAEAAHGRVVQVVRSAQA